MAYERRAPLLAPGGVGVVVLPALADGQQLDVQTVSGAVLAGILSGGAAVGVTELGRKADQFRAPAPPEAAVDRPTSV